MSFADGLLVVPEGQAEAPLADPLLESNLQKHAKVSGVLFPRPPSTSDVLQGQLGNCYMLAAINSVVSMKDGPQQILSSMRDNKDGTVTVRLYRDGKAHYLRQQKSQIQTSEKKIAGLRVGTGQTLHSTGALWVVMLEKACVAFLGGAPRTYKEAEGGSGREIMQALVEGSGRVVAPKKLSNQEAFATMWGRLVFDCGSHNQLATTVPKVKNSCLKQMSENIFPEDGPEYLHANRWWDWCDGGNKSHLEFFNKAPSNDKFVRLMETIGTDLHPETRRLVLRWVKDNNPWRCGVGRAEYTHQELDLFKMVQRLLTAQHAITAGTRHKLSGVSGGVGNSGETKVSGLAAKHEYSVLKTKEDGVGRKYLLLRNPWGYYGRSYQSDHDRGVGQVTGLSPQETDSAESWIELTDFFDTFTVNLEVGPQVHGSAKTALLKDLKR